MRKTMTFSTVLVSLVLSAFAAHAEDAAPAADEALKVNGYVDVYYSYNTNSPAYPAQQTGASPFAPATNNKYRAFDQYHNDINLSLAELLFTKKTGEVTAKVALDFGRLVEVMSPADEVTKNVTQATITYNPQKLSNLSLTVGKMITHMGLEGMKGGDNWNYSRSLLFNYAAPFWHEGLAVSWAFVPGKYTGTFFLYNNSVGLVEENSNKHYGLQFIAAPIDGLTLAYNGIAGKEGTAYTFNNRMIHDLNGTYKFNDSWAAQFDVIMGSEEDGATNGDDASWLAWNIGVKWNVGDWTFSPRYGSYDDEDGATIDGTSQKLQTYTLTAKYNMGSGLETLIEYRMDDSDADVFVDDKNQPTGDQSTISAAAIFNF